MRISDWSSDVCSSDLAPDGATVPDASARQPLLNAVSAFLALSKRKGVGSRKPRTGNQNSFACIDRGADAAGAFHEERFFGHRSHHPRHPAAAGGRIPPGWARPSLLAEHPADDPRRSEEHTSELQSLMRISYAVFCLQKKKLNVHT